MRIAVAEITQETDTFSPVLTQLEDFELNGLWFGAEVLAKGGESGKLGGFVAAIREEKQPVEPLPIIHARATSGGRIARDALEFFKEKLVAGLRAAAPLDGVFLSLHGAAAAQGVDDLEGYLLAAARETVGPAVPIVVPLDHHANITQLMMKSANIVVGHATQPHDPFDTGLRATRLLYALIRGDFKPAVGWRKIPMIAPQDHFFTSYGPMKEWFDLARAMEERPGVISVSPFPMQPWLDVEEGGWTAVVYTAGKPALAEALAVELANKAWQLREQYWVSPRIAPSEAIRRAVAAPKGLIVLSDTGDSVYGGSPGDSTCLLSEMLKQDIPCTAFVPIVDPQAVEIAVRRGAGAQVTLSLGGKWDNIFCQPVAVTGTVKAISAGLGLFLPPRGYVEVGRTILLEAGKIQIVIADRRTSAINYPIMYTHVGLDVAQAKMVVLKTVGNVHHFEPWRSEIIRVDSPGMTQSDLTQFTWRRVPRPMYPLDALPSWQA